MNKAKMQKILLFGGSGLVGSRFIQLLHDQYKIIAPRHSSLDVNNHQSVAQFISRLKPDRIIYSAGLTSVDQAEKNPDLAFSLNFKAPGAIAKKAAKLNIPVIFLSTDAVFQGTKKSRPYREDDTPKPFSVYGRSKLVGERVVLAASRRNIVARVIMVYSHDSSRRKGFIQMAIDTIKSGEKYYGITDQIINPIYVDDIVNAISRMIDSGTFGIYHLGAADYVSNFEFIKKVAKVLKLNSKVVMGITMEEFLKNKLAKRAKYCWLDVSKFVKCFGKGILHSNGENLKHFKKNLEIKQF